MITSSIPSIAASFSFGIGRQPYGGNANAKVDILRISQKKAN
ncbi:hypothetical protein [Mucilaginibacter sp.]|nr:hypothetical protein [Mucilaginibacter sp.]